MRIFFGFFNCNLYFGAVFLAPTVPLIRQHFEFAKNFPGLRAKYVIGDSTVDSWGRKQWNDAIDGIDVILITPQLFLDALTARNLELTHFCILVFDECQQCVGSHPYSRIFSDHYIHARPAGSIRVVGLAETLVKRKVKEESEVKQAIRKLEKSMHSQMKEAESLLLPLSTSTQHRLECERDAPALDAVSLSMVIEPS